MMGTHDAALPDDLAKLSLVGDPNSNFVQQAYLTYCIPTKTDLDADKALEDVESGAEFLEKLSKRDSLFFDETINVLLILKAPWLEESDLKSIFSRLVISLEARITGTEDSDKDASSQNVIFSGTVPDASDPLTLVDEGSDSDDGSTQTIYAIWKMPVFLARPRTRIPHPSVVFAASARLMPEVSAELNSKSNGYLQSGMPLSLNLLQSFGSDLDLKSEKPRLSALRVSRVAPVTRQQELMKHLRALQQLKLRIYPIVHTRIRFSYPNTLPPCPTVLALLEIDFTPHFDCEVLLDEIKLNLIDGVVTSLNDQAGITFPMACVSHDHVTFFYHLTPSEISTLSPKKPSRELEISMSATVQATIESCTPKLSISWRTSVDFQPPLNPGYSPAATGLQRAHRPSQLSISGGQTVTPFKSPSVTQPDALPALEAATSRTETSLPDLGITMSFTGPSEPVYPGQVFSWNVHVVNRSLDTTHSRQSRKLALVAMPRRRKADKRSGSVSLKPKKRPGKELAPAIVDEHHLFAMQQESLVDSTDIVCLSADTRVGPLAPGACHVVELQFLPLGAGLIGIDAVRVVDLASQEHVDIRELPTTVVEPIAA